MQQILVSSWVRYGYKNVSILDVCHTFEDVAHIQQKSWYLPTFIFEGMYSFAV